MSRELPESSTFFSVPRQYIKYLKINYLSPTFTLCPEKFFQKLTAARLPSRSAVPMPLLEQEMRVVNVVDFHILSSSGLAAVIC